MRLASQADKWEGMSLVTPDTDGLPNVVQHILQLQGQRKSRSGQQMAMGCLPAPPLRRDSSAWKLQKHYNAFPACARPLALCTLILLDSETRQVICNESDNIAEDMCHLSAATCQKMLIVFAGATMLTLSLTFCYAEASVLQLLGRLVAVIPCLVSQIECQRSANRVL